MFVRSIPSVRLCSYFVLLTSSSFFLTLGFSSFFTFSVDPRLIQRKKPVLCFGPFTCTTHTHTQTCASFTYWVESILIHFDRFANNKIHSNTKRILFLLLLCTKQNQRTKTIFFHCSIIVDDNNNFVLCSCSVQYNSTIA